MVEIKPYQAAPMTSKLACVYQLSKRLTPSMEYTEMTKQP